MPRAADGRLDLAVDVSNWLRPDAPTGVDRLFRQVYGRSGRSSDQFVPGWPYSVVAALESGRTSWCRLRGRRAPRSGRRRRRGHRCPGHRCPGLWRVRLEEPDRLRTRLLGPLHRGAACMGRSPRNGGIGKARPLTGSGRPGTAADGRTPAADGPSGRPQARARGRTPRSRRR
ncbi:transposase [Streptomyces sp. NBC_00876]|uniref:transposase n=1 Tax=Streptomyces sp. NBC_00876 TaxID=2975853 RepID=UPI0038669B31|nr:transposase [Streptomyces sp. NBC_00876]